MCDVAERLEQKGKLAGRIEGRIEGEKKGRIEGRIEGEKKLARLISALLADNRPSDVARAASDAEYREQLYKEYHITTE